MRNLLTALAMTALAAGAQLSASAAAAAEANRTVVELFTSQGCSSCPPADAFLGELAARDDVLALSFHVDYWNYLGWSDPFSSPEATKRQHDYRRTLGSRYVYTPQMVINGSSETVGVRKDQVRRLIDTARATNPVPIALDHDGSDRATVRIGRGPAQAKPAAIWLALYDRRHTTDIRRGENEGVRLTNSNVVRVFRHIGSWSGDAVTVDLSLRDLGAAGRDACAVIVQSDGSGPILGAVTFPLPRPRS